MAMNNRRSGALREILNFQERTFTDDGFGNQVPGSTFVTRHTVRGHLAPRTGGEEITAARLDGRQPFVLTVRHSHDMLNVLPSWRISDKNNNKKVYAITSPFADPDGTGAWLECIVVLGGES